jgi:predicted secreted protein
MAKKELPVIRVRRTFIEPGQKVKPGPRPPPDAAGLRYDMSQFYGMKSVLEELFGHSVYMRLKETGTIQDWRRETRRLLDAIQLTSNSTVEITDQNWRDEMAEIIDHGKRNIAKAKHIDDLFCYLSAALTRIVFLQLGNIPLRPRTPDLVPLTKAWWTLTGFRSVQYTQTDRQRTNLETLLARRAESARRLQEEDDARAKNP